MIFALNLKPKSRPKYFNGNSDILHPKIVTNRNQLCPRLTFIPEITSNQVKTYLKHKILFELASQKTNVFFFFLISK